MAAVYQQSSVMTFPQPKAVHPFFQKSDCSGSQYPNQVEKEANINYARNRRPEDRRSAEPIPFPRRTRQDCIGEVKVEQEANEAEQESIASLDKASRKSANAGVDTRAPIFRVVDKSRRKRRRLSLPDEQGSSWFEQLEVAADDAPKDGTTRALLNETKGESLANSNHFQGTTSNFNRAVAQDVKDSNSEEIVQSDPVPLDSCDATSADPTELERDTTAPAHPKKILKLNGSGGLGSPKSRKAQKKNVDESQSQDAIPAKRGRKKKQLLVVIHYGNGDESVDVGSKIDRIFLDTPVVPPKTTPAVPSLVEGVNTSKPAHPLFRRKLQGVKKEVKSLSAAAKSSANDPPRITVTSTPGKLRYQRQQAMAAGLPDEDIVYEPRSDRVYRVPGTVDAAWPSKYSATVQPPATGVSLRKPLQANFGVARHKKPSAYVDESETFLRRYAGTLPLMDSHGLQTEIGSGLEVQIPPQRLIISGVTLRARVLERLHPEETNRRFVTHPASLKLLDAISTEQSSFDLGRCDNLLWAHKYAPKTTAEVLQGEREMRVIKSWLETQTVSSTSMNPLTTQTQGNVLKLYPQPNDALQRKRRKRRKVSADDLDDFIVGSDEEGSALRDLSDDEGSVASSAPILRSLVQESAGVTGGEVGKATNAILISGPHGCGKTAAVFAAAKELDFEVFEIGPSSRRSGKDILDKVGDMAKNHQVSRAAKIDAAALGPDCVEATDAEDFTSAEPAPDQSTLTSFFGVGKRPKPKTILKPNAKPRTRPETTFYEKRYFKGSKRQKQSLILLEEVDVLFEQDRQFWETVLYLAHQSKRPIVMTCNDESLVPLDDLSLHALLRFHKPSEFLVAEFLVLLAAAEGHLLTREAVLRLYNVKGRDLRATIMELNFWCQMALDDPKGGMSWYLPRWPAGADIDTNGEKLRVVSIDTYTASTGVLGDNRAPLDSSSAHDESLVQEAWTEWLVAPSIFSAKLFDIPRADNLSAVDNLGLLREMESCMDMRSAAEYMSCVDIPAVSIAQEILDCSIPPLPLSQRGDFIEGQALLQMSRMIDHQQLDTQLATFIHLSLRKCFSNALAPHPPEGIRSGTNLLRETLDQIYMPVADQEADRERNGAELIQAMSFTTEPAFNSYNSKLLATEISPYARSIAAFDLALEQQRLELAGPGKKLRQTRASRSALEGGVRAQTRRERWFGKGVDLRLILRTGGSTLLSTSRPETSAPDEVGSQNASGCASRESSLDELA